MKRRRRSDLKGTATGMAVGAVAIGGLWLGASLFFHMAGGLSDHPMTLSQALRQWPTILLVTVGMISGGVLGGIVGSALVRRP